MESNSKFRNHVSVILENSLKTIGTVLAIYILNIISDVGEAGISSADIVFLVVIFVVVLAVALGIQTFLWAKTYISIEENTLVVERNTLNKKRNTIGLKNISNVNLEQNLLEMILGTCKVKLDTNSLSTADETDVNIVLKKADAEQFRSWVLAKIEGKEIREEEKKETVTETISSSEETEIVGHVGDIILHGLFSIRIIMFILLIGIIALQVWSIAEHGADSLGETMGEIFASVFVAFYFAAIILWGIVKEFIKYLNFRIERKKDKVYLSYGLFKKVAYSVPVDKINGIRLAQTPLARMGRRYMVEIINVGMDDDENEMNTFFLPYNKLENIQKQLHQLLPEFDGALEIKEEKQPKAVWLLSLPWLVLYIFVAWIVYILVGTYAPDRSLQEGVIAAAVVVLIWRTITKLAGFLTKAIKVDDRFLKIVDGKFARRILLVKYDKIQYVTGRQCVIAKRFKIQKGTISLLAALKNRIHELPYFKENDMEQLKSKLI